jgi:hypothetical protein
MNTHYISLAVAFFSFFSSEFCILVYKMHRLEQFIEEKKKTSIGHYLLD